MTGPELAAHLCTRDLSLPSFVDLCLVTAPRGSNCACAGTGVTLRHVSETSMLIVSLRGRVTKAAAVFVPQSGQPDRPDDGLRPAITE